MAHHRAQCRKKRSKGGSSDSGRGALFISSIERNFCTLISVILQIETFFQCRSIDMILFSDGALLQPVKCQWCCDPHLCSLNFLDFSIDSFEVRYFASRVSTSKYRSPVGGK